MNETLVHRGPDSSGAFVEGNVGAGRAAAVDHRPRRRRPAGRQRGRPHPGRPERRDLQLPRAARAARARRAPVPRRAATPRCSCTCTRSAARRSSRSCAACSRSRSGTGSSGAWCSRATASGSSRSTTGSRDGELSFASELKALLRQPGFSREVDLDALEAYLAFNSIPAPLTIFAEARKLPPGHILLCASRASRPLRRYARPRPAPAGRERAEDERDARRGAARAAARLGARAPRVGRAGGRAALGRDRLLGAGGAGGARERLPGEHVLDRLRGARVQRARSGAPGRRAVRHRPPRADRAPGRRRAAAPARARRSTSRSPTRPRCPTYLVSELAAGTVKVALSGRGRRRAVRRLPHLCGRQRSRRASGALASALRPLVERAAQLVRPR